MKVLKNSGWLVFDKVIQGILSLLVGVWVARYLGPEQYGQLAYIIAYLAFFQVLANLGLDGIVVRDIARIQHDGQKVVSCEHRIASENLSILNPNQKIGEILGTVFALRLITGVVCWLSAVLLMVVLEGWQSQLVVLTTLAGGMLIFQAADTIDLWFQSQSQSRRTVLAKMVAYLTSNGLRVVFILGKLPLTWFATAMFVEFALAAAALFYAYRQFDCGAVWRRKIKELGVRFVSSSWAFVFAGLVNLIQARIEFFVINKYLGAESVGQYAVALRTIEVFDIVAGIIAVSIFPKLSGIKGDIVNHYFRKIYRYFILLYLLLSPVILLCYFFFDTIYGQKYLIAKSLFALMICRPLLSYLGAIRGLSIIIDNKTWYSFFCSSLGCFIAVTIAFIMIPIYGINWAVFSALISYTISNFLIDFFMYRKNFYNILQIVK